MRERVREDVEDRDGEPQHNGTPLVDEDGSSGGGLRHEFSSFLRWLSTSWWFLRLAAARSRLIVMVVGMKGERCGLPLLLAEVTSWYKIDQSEFLRAILVRGSWI